MRSFASLRLACAAVALVVHSAPAGRAEPAQARDAYMAIVAREDVLRREMDARHPNEESALLLRRIRNVVGEYDLMAGQFRKSGYGDNALWQAALLSADAYWTFGEPVDRDAALRCFAALATQFPASSLNRQAASHVTRLQAAPYRAPVVALSPPHRAAAIAAAATSGVTLTSIRRESLPGALRVTLELDREVSFRDERLDTPPRVFIDLRNARTVAGLKDATLAYADDVVRQVRVGRPQGDVTRVVFDLQGAGRHSVYQLYEPYRIVLDIERAAARDTKAASTARDTRNARVGPGPAATWVPDVLPSRRITVPPPSSRDSDSEAAVAVATAKAPEAPSRNGRGGFSLSRQLGLGIARVVIDPGHGGHDPGARVKGLNEADLVLDVALRLEKLLLDQPGVEVLLTRRSNVYVPLEQRTGIANREGADLFLSIHANASENAAARGLETYFLNFAANPDAEKIAARENAGAGRTMNSLPEIVKAIALNNKIDESRDFAALVQASMVDRLRKSNKQVRDLGVKQAPFMVLIGATMPSVLSEISFITNKDEASLLKTGNYRQSIAESLRNAIMGYQRALKTAPRTIASQ